MAYIGRLAPSPTGLLHLGHARTFLTAHTRAQAAGGRLLLRLDDLDQARSRPAFAQAALHDLCWLGFWSSGNAQEDVWYQSRRTEAYIAGWQTLVAGGYLYPCRCTRRELKSLAHAPHENAPQAEEPLYPGTCRPAVPDCERWLSEGPAGHNWRFRIPDDEAVPFHDGHHGPQHFVAGRDFGDFLIWRRDGVPAYQLATVVDDATMGITEVVRGADLLLSTARQLLLFRAFGLAAPRWFHCPLVLDEQGERLAKRTDALSIQALRQRGLSPSQVIELASQASISRP